MERPFAYNGIEPYIFVSYSHKNCDRVWPIIERLEKDGYRVWYDDGISPGTEWDVNIADHITHCGYFFALVTKDYLESDNCRDELNFVRELKKPMLLIYLEDVELPAEMKMRLGRLQAVQWFTYTNEENAFVKLRSTAGLDVCWEKPEKADAESGVSGKGPAGTSASGPRVRRPGGYTPEKAEESRPRDFTPEKVRDDRPKGYTPEKADAAPGKTDTADAAPKQSDKTDEEPKRSETADKAPEQESILTVSPAGVELVPGKQYDGQDKHSAGNRSETEAEEEWTVENKAGEILGRPDFSNQSEPVKEADFSSKPEEGSDFADKEKNTEKPKKQTGKGKKKKGMLVLLLAVLAVAVSAAWTVISNMGSSKGTLNDLRFIYGVAADKDAKGRLSSQKYQMLDYNGMECEVSVVPYSIHLGPDASKTVTVTFLDRYGEEFTFYGTADLRKSVLKISEGGNKEKAYAAEAAPLKTSLKYTVSKYGVAYSLTGYGKTAYFSWKSKIDGYFDVEGYLSEGSESYRDLAGLRLKCDPATGKPDDVAILFTNGGHAESISVKSMDTEQGRIELEWKKVVRPYNGRIETDEVNGSLIIYISDQYPYGFSNRSGEAPYYYLDKIPEDLDPGEASTES
ncbi:MAG: TIR domain-containing protein [Lachnospiraceae bacterium]|nr:TIR domain-containing protein [Lachnospiraceae bacterium]